MYCKYCKTKNPDDAVYCLKCGRRVDGVVLCAKCGRLSIDGNFCVYCGEPLDENKRYRIPTEPLDFCPTCGRPVEPVNIVLPEGDESKNGDIAMAGSVSEIKRNTAPSPLLMAFSIVGMLGVLAVFVFTFLTGISYTKIDDGVEFTSSRMLYYFFGDIYAGVGSGAEKGIAVLGTILSAAMILTMAAMTCVTFVSFVRYITGHTEKSPMKKILTTYFLYVAFVLMLRSLISYCYKADVTYGISEVTLKLSSLSLAGLISGGTLVAFSYIGGLAASYDAGERSDVVTEIVFPVVCVVLLAVSAVLLSGAAFKYSYDFDFARDYRSNNSYFAAFREGSGKYSAGYMQYCADLGEYSSLGYGVTAQVFTFLFIFFAFMAVRGIMARMYDTDAGRKDVTEISLSAVCGVLLLIFSVLLGHYILNNFFDGDAWYDGLDYNGDVNVNYGILISGFVIFAAFVVTYIVHLSLKKKK
ncbi:MAG: zinc ribbon domain-containing protein [Clostridia bacterium]|nr:zinc ribbon domain-containing protein [Clostridia bacterium]